MKSLRSLSSYLLKLISNNISDELDDIDITYTDTTPKPAAITDSAPKFQYPEIFIDIDRRMYLQNHQQYSNSWHYTHRLYCRNLIEEP